jgi:hypothetical protein
MKAFLPLKIQVAAGWPHIGQYNPGRFDFKPGGPKISGPQPEKARWEMNTFIELTAQTVDGR